MSFINPIKLPVMKFDSTDKDAPQLNYNARTSGDIKTILKACLVTGYGEKQGAGWSVVEESDFGIFLKSPHIQMADYVFIVNDSSTSNTIYQYSYQGAVANISTINKSVKNADKSQSGWCMLVTELGFILLERFYGGFGVACRLTYWGAMKSTLKENNGKNLCFYNIGWGGETSINSLFSSNNIKGEIHSFANNIKMDTLFRDMNGYRDVRMNQVAINAINKVYAVADTKVLVAEMPAILLKTTGDSNEICQYNEAGDKIVCTVALDNSNSKSYIYTFSLVLLIATDFWEF